MELSILPAALDAGVAAEPSAPALSTSMSRWTIKGHLPGKSLLQTSEEKRGQRVADV